MRVFAKCLIVLLLAACTTTTPIAPTGKPTEFGCMLENTLVAACEAFELAGYVGVKLMPAFLPEGSGFVKVWYTERGVEIYQGLYFVEDIIYIPHISDEAVLTIVPMSNVEFVLSDEIRYTITNRETVHGV